MRAFLLVAQIGSFIGAAERLGISASVISKRINQLEWLLGGQLLVRTTRSVHLTDLGDRQLQRMRRLVREFDELRSGAADQPSMLAGNVRLSAPAAMTTVLLGPALADFRKRYPQVTLEVVVIDRTVNPAEASLDVSIVVLPLICDGVVEEVLGPYPRVLCAAPSYLAEHGVPAHPHDLVDHACITFTPSARSWTFIGANGPIGVAIHPAASASDSRVVIEMVRNGMGISALSRLTVAKALATGEVRELMPNYPMPDLQVKALIPENRVRLARVQAIVDCIKAHLDAIQPAV
ncbi:LysR substrate-binding domain-containing protein [Xanthobacteraceae bacterium Astr-EGSB]|uniref:LysR family transcriptional regulator n=1 Tax=Astrobacterium formosum TaxID=3069710 RepID=UPI0027B7EE9F|nr:LysR substrate-binding domain-containing protein [Xanthobacteraceae bacterium Astr-EGSB]